MIAAKITNHQSWSIIDLDNNQIIPCVSLELNINNVVPPNYHSVSKPYLNIRQDITANFSINPNIDPDALWVMSWVNECFSNSLTFAKKKTLAILCDNPVVLYGCFIKNYTNSDSNFFSTIGIEISCDFYEQGFESEIFKQFKRDDSLNKILGIII